MLWRREKCSFFAANLIPTPRSPCPRLVTIAIELSWPSLYRKYMDTNITNSLTDRELQCQVWGSYGGDYEELGFLECTTTHSEREPNVYGGHITTIFNVQAWAKIEIDLYDIGSSTRRPPALRSWWWWMWCASEKLGSLQTSLQIQPKDYKIYRNYWYTMRQLVSVSHELKQYIH
jgi:hypothetical protein